MLQQKVLRKTICGLLILVVLDMVATGLWLSAITKFANFPCASRAQVAMIFFGDFTPNYKAMGKETLRRVQYALKLHQDGKFEFFLCSGGSRPKRNAYGADLMRDYLVTQGVPEEKIVTERFSFDTKSNWRNAKLLIKEKNWQSLYLISSPWHLYRIKQIVRRTSSDNVLISFAPVSVSAARPAYTKFSIWMQAHYEWLATLAETIPKPLRDPLIKTMRYQ